MGSHVWLRVDAELPDGDVGELETAFPGVAFSVDPKDDDLKDIDIVFTRTRLPDETAARLSSLKWIHTTYGGGLSFLTPPVVERGITVTCSRGVQAEPLSEFTEACVLALAKKLPRLHDLKQKRQWDDRLVLDTLSGKIAGLLGLGAVGSAVAKRLHRHGMRIHAIRRNIHDVPSYVERVSALDGLPGLLAEADVLVIGLPPIEGLHGLIGENELRNMKPTSLVINLVSRGVIGDAALAQALRSGWIGGAACNVFETNPLPADSALWDAPNLIVSPGIAQTDPQRWLKLRTVFTDNLERYLRGAPMANIVDGKGAY